MERETVSFTSNVSSYVVYMAYVLSIKNRMSTETCSSVVSDAHTPSSPSIGVAQNEPSKRNPTSSSSVGFVERVAVAKQNEQIHAQHKHGTIVPLEVDDPFVLVCTSTGSPLKTVNRFAPLATENN